MALLSQKELANRKEPKRERKRKEPTLRIEKEVEKSWEWVFFHPENPADQYLTKVMNMVIDGEAHQIPVIGGKVSVFKNNVADFFLKRGWELIDKKEVV